MTFQNRKIVEMSGTRFGMVLHEREAKVLLNNGFNVKTKIYPGEDFATYYLVVWVKATKLQEGFNLSRLDRADRVDIVIHPEAWNAVGRRGVKCYVVATWDHAYNPETDIVKPDLRETIASLKAVRAGWAFGVPEDGQEEWLDQVVSAVRSYYLG